jgi:Flp pilus assembly protein TadG
MLVPSARGFGRDSRGATAVLFGLSSFLLMIAIGVALDSARVYSISDKVRSGLDAAALAGAKLLDVENASDADVRTRAMAYFDTYRASLTGSNVSLRNFTVTTNRSDGTVTTAVEVNYETVFGKLISLSNVKFTPSTTVAYKTRKIELALVLDITGSMADDGKIAALRSAARDLIDVMQANNPDPGAVRIGIVPYSASVNVGSAYYTAATNVVGGHDTCVVERQTMPGAIFDDAPGPGRWVATSSRYDNRSYFCPNAQIIPLQDVSVAAQKTALQNLVASLHADGSTAGHIGLAWGWYMLSPNWQGFWPPSSSPKNNGSDVLKAVLLMTDGIFNTSYWTPNGASNGDDYSVEHSSGDLALSLCQNARDAGIVVYTVGFEAPPAAEALLQACAGSAANAFVASGGNDLNEKFRAIGERLSLLRLSK